MAVDRGEGTRAPKPYNPLEKRRLGESIVRELLESTPEALPPSGQFVGAGIYAIYYTGDFELYEPLARLNADGLVHPIYVGKAIPPGGRKGGALETPTTRTLFNRLAQHAGSVVQAENLDLSGFQCKFLVVDDVWISLAEALLIDIYRPLWNLVIDGFGNHDVGMGRRAGKRSSWDALHPGRPWANELPASALTIAEIETAAAQHLRKLPKK